MADDCLQVIVPWALFALVAGLGAGAVLVIVAGPSTFLPPQAIHVQRNEEGQIVDLQAA